MRRNSAIARPGSGSGLDAQAIGASAGLGEDNPVTVRDGRIGAAGPAVIGREPPEIQP